MANLVSNMLPFFLKVGFFHTDKFQRVGRGGEVGWKRLTVELRCILEVQCTRFMHWGEGVPSAQSAPLGMSACQLRLNLA